MKIHKYKFTLFLHVHFITSVSSDKIVLQVHSGMPHTKRTNLPQIQLKSPSLQINIYHAMGEKNSSQQWDSADRQTTKGEKLSGGYIKLRSAQKMPR